MLFGSKDLQIDIYKTDIGISQEDILILNNVILAI